MNNWGTFNTLQLFIFYLDVYLITLYGRYSTAGSSSTLLSINNE